MTITDQEAVEVLKRMVDGSNYIRLLREEAAALTRAIEVLEARHIPAHQRLAFRSEIMTLDTRTLNP